MPILKPEELSGYIGKIIADQLTRDAKSFQLAEQSASTIVATKTGITIPDDAAEAPLWAKEAVAYIIQFKRITVLANASPSLISQVGAQYREAMTTLDSYKISTPTGRPGSEWGEQEGVLKW